MKKLSEFADNEAIEVMADIIDPVSVLLSDKDFVKACSGSSKKDIVKSAMKNHSKEIMAIFAAFDRVPVEEYHCNIATVIRDGITLLNDEDLLSVFTLQGQKKEKESFGSAMVNSKAED